MFDKHHPFSHEQPERVDQITRTCYGNQKHDPYCLNNADTIKNSPNTNTFHPTFSPSITINITTESTPTSIGLDTQQYITYAKEEKYIYTDEDALKQYGSSLILNPGHVSYMNLFVNGVLQPPTIYHVEEGKLILKSSDSPPSNAPIILLFVIVKNPN